MKINLSKEMIEKIKKSCAISFGIVYDLHEKEECIKDTIAVGQTEIQEKDAILKEVEKAIQDACDINTLLVELVEQINSELCE
jgi:hypothetical protein